jgi:hypothetical protein
MDLESNAFYFILFYLGSLKENLFTFWIKVYCFLSFSGVLVNGSRGFVLFIQFFGLLCRCSKVDNGFLRFFFCSEQKVCFFNDHGRGV